MHQTSPAGRRMAMATHPAVVAGGMTICTRSPPGKRCRQQRRARIDALLSGIGDQLRESQTPIEVRLRQRLASPAAAGLHDTPRRGRLMQSSVTSGSASRGLKAPQRQRQARSAVPPASPVAARSRYRAGDASQLIDRPEIHVARHQHLDAVAVSLGDRGRDVDRPFSTSVMTPWEADGIEIDRAVRCCAWQRSGRRRRRRRSAWRRRTAPRSDD